MEILCYVCKMLKIKYFMVKLGIRYDRACDFRWRGASYLNGSGKVSSPGFSALAVGKNFTGGIELFNRTDAVDVRFY